MAERNPYQDNQADLSGNFEMLLRVELCAKARLESPLGRSNDFMRTIRSENIGIDIPGNP
jgi:hypothetical protein